MVKNTNVLRIKIPPVNNEMRLTERVERLEALTMEIVTALKVDLSMMDLENFSKHGINQLNERIKEKIKSEAVSE